MRIGPHFYFNIYIVHFKFSAWSWTTLPYIQNLKQNVCSEMQWRALTGSSTLVDTRADLKYLNKVTIGLNEREIVLIYNTLTKYSYALSFLTFCPFTVTIVDSHAWLWNAKGKNDMWFSNLQKTEIWLVPVFNLFQYFRRSPLTMTVFWGSCQRCSTKDKHNICGNFCLMHEKILDMFW